MNDGIFRQHELVERCFVCAATASVRCACCNRPRCAAHVERRLCNRCTQAVERELGHRDGRAWTVGGSIGVLGALALTPLIAASAIFFAVPIAVIAGFGYRRFDRARTIRALGIPLAISSGELPPEPREPDFDNSGTTGMPGVP